MARRIFARRRYRALKIAAVLAAAFLSLSVFAWQARIYPRFFHTGNINLAPPPQPTVSEHKPLLVPVADFKTYFNPDQVDRVHNIRLAAGALDGFYLRPGQTLSFNAIVGPRTAERGYREALVIEDQKFVLGIGGGVCQVSSALYNAALLAGLKIAERTAHGLKVDYIEPGLDATVVDSRIDLKISNPYDVGLLLKTSVGVGFLQMTFYAPGPGLPWSIEVETQTEVLPPPERLIYDPDLAPHQSFTASYGRPGYKVRVWRLYKSGERLERREFISEDVYRPLPVVIRVGALTK